MPPSPQFFFEPIREARRGIEAKDHCVTISIPLSGQMKFGYEALKEFGLITENGEGLGCWISLFSDPRRRALAFKFVFKNRQDMLSSAHTKWMQVHKYEKAVVAGVGVMGAIQNIPNVKLPTGKLEVKKFKDHLVGEVYYIILPKEEKPEKNDEQL